MQAKLEDDETLYDFKKRGEKIKFTSAIFYQNHDAMLANCSILFDDSTVVNDSSKNKHEKVP